MGQLLHGCAKTTIRVRKDIQESTQSLASLARHYGINIKTASKWKNCAFFEDVSIGPKERKSTVLTREKESIITPVVGMPFYR